MPSDRKRGKLGLERPLSIGPVTGWWFPWQVRPRRLADGARYQRTSVYRRRTANVKKAQRFKRQHEYIHGSWCVGAAEIAHKPHFLKGREFLTVDHVLPLAKGGTWARSNLRVICNKANLRLNGKLVNGNQ
jgi:hypothetical protein